MSAPERTTRDQVDWVLDLFRRATRYWMLVGTVFILGAALSLTLGLGKKPQYESEVVLLYQEMISQSVLQGRDVVKSSRSLSSRYKEMVFSRSQLSKIVEKFNMFPDVVEDEGMVSATEILRQRIIFRDNGTGTFRIVYRGDSREEAKEVTAEIAEQLKKQDNEVRQLQATTTKEFLLAEKNEAEDRLIQSELELAEFLAEHPEFAEETASAVAGAAIRVKQGDRKSTPTPSRGGDAQLAALLRQRRRTKALLENPSAAPPPVSVVRGKKSPEYVAAERAVSSAQRELDNARAKLATAQSRFTDRHPDVKDARASVAIAERKLAQKKAEMPGESAAVTVAPSKPVDKDALRLQLSELDREIAARRRRGPQAAAPVARKSSRVATDLVQTETFWTKLLRQSARDREAVERLESRLFTANITASSEFADASQLTVIDEAFLPPSPAGRSRKIVAVAGALFFGLLGIALALGLALIDDRIFRRRELEVISGLPVMATIPEGSPRWWQPKPVRRNKRKGADHDR